MTETNSNRAQSLLNQVVEDLVANLESPETRERLQVYLVTMARFHRYSWGNQVLIALQRPNSTYVAGYQTWKRIGRYVRRGERGIAILAPVPYQSKTDENESDTLSVRMRFRTAYVFDASQTDGEPLPTLMSPTDQDPSELTTRLEAWCESQNIAVER